MHFYRRMCGGFAILFIVILLTSCGALGGSNAPQAQTKATPTLPPTPTPGPGQQLLSTMAQKFNTASTLHGVFDDLEFNAEHHHADRRSHDWQKNDDRGVGTAQRAMFSVEVSAHPVVE